MPELTPQLEDTLRFFAKKFPELDVSCIFTCVRLLSLSNQLIEAFDAQFARNDLSKGRFRILINLVRTEGAGLSPAELSDCCGVTRATVTGLLDTLAAADLIERIPDEDDRRGIKIRLTVKGEEKVMGLLPDHYRRIAELMAPLTKTEREQLLKLIDKISIGIPVMRDP